MRKSEQATKLVGLADVVQMTGLEHRRLIRLIQAGDLPAEKLPGRTGAYIVKLADAKALAEKLASEAEERAAGIRAALAEEVAS